MKIMVSRSGVRMMGMLVTVLLLGVMFLGGGCTVRLGSNSHRSETRSSWTSEANGLELQLPGWDAAVTNATPVRGNWRANGEWLGGWIKEITQESARDRQLHLQIRSRLADGRAFEYIGLAFRGSQFRVVEGMDAAGPLQLEIELSTARMILRGERNRSEAGGELEIVPNAAFVNRGGELLDGELTVGQLLRFGTLPQPLEYIELVCAKGGRWTWSEVLRLQQRGVNPSFIQALRRAPEAGAPKDASTPREGPAQRQPFTAEDLVLLHSRGVSVEYVEEMDAAGTEFSASDLVLLRSRGVSPEYVREMGSAGQMATASELVLLRSRGVPADYVAAFRAAGYQFKPEEFVLLRSRGVSADYAKELKEAGYHLSSNDLVLLRSRGVPVDYLKEIADANYQPLKASEALRLHSAGVPAETVRRLRK